MGPVSTTVTAREPFICFDATKPVAGRKRHNIAYGSQNMA